MFDFFLPASKVQKDRKILRETDARMAKYSRRGLLFNFIVYIICIVDGRFISEHFKLAVVLTSGLLLITVLRGYFLVRFDHLYPRAPAKWRRSYFIVTLLGALWWGVILSAITLTLRLNDEAHLIWLYTVIFFSTTANAFAPYNRFLSYYQFLGLIPAATSAIFLGTINGYLYGFLLLAFYLMLTRQCRLISENYWERRESAYALSKKTLSIEEQKRETKSTEVLNREFLSYLNRDLSELLSQFRTAAPTTDGSVQVQVDLEILYRNIRDFDGIISNDLRLDNKIFNIRHEIQHVISDFVEQAEVNRVQIESALSASLPMRLRGDAVRVAQILNTLMSNILKDARDCIILVEVEFLREYESAGELYITVSRNLETAKRKILVDDKLKPLSDDIPLTVAKALATKMNGSIEFIEHKLDEQKIRFNAKIEVASREGQLDFHKDTFAGRNVLFAHSKPRIVDIKRQELDALGFNVFTETQYKRAFQTLMNSYKFQKPIESILYYYEPDTEQVEEFSNLLRSEEKLKYTQKLVAATRDQQDVMRAAGYDESSGFFYVDKPMGLFELESTFTSIFDRKQVDDYSPHNRNVYLFCDKNNLDERLEKVLDDLGCTIKKVAPNSNLDELLLLDGNELLLLDYDSLENVGETVDWVREHEDKCGCANYLPLIGVSAFKSEMEEDIYELGLDDFVDLAHNAKKNPRLNNKILG